MNAPTPLQIHMMRHLRTFNNVSIEFSDGERYVVATVDIVANFHPEDRQGGVYHDWFEFNSMTVLSVDISDDSGFISADIKHLTSDDMHNMEAEIQETYLDLK